MRLLVTIALFGLVPAVSPAADPVAGLKLPHGFTVAEFSTPDLANDVTVLHVDARGRVVVGGRGYVRELLDTDGDGKADRTRELVAGLNGAPMGLLWEGDTLYVVADGGLKRYRGAEGSKPATNPETVLALKASGEHDAHAVRHGPDGWLYLMCGNMAGVTKQHVTGPNSPVKDPVAGCLVRIHPDRNELEVVADGFRNAYDFDFSLAGRPHTFDSDNERCVGLPWYEPTRFYAIRSGGHHGWQSPRYAQTWRKPPYFADVVPPVCTLGRGSPTGVACYRHTQFPEAYRGGFFLADWTFGTVWLVAAGSKQPKPFLETTGANGFAPTGLAVHPTTGELFVSVGGRGTRGGVYRVRSANGPSTPAPLPYRSEGAPPDATDAAGPLNRVRSIQLKLGDLCAASAMGTVWEGYTFRKPVPPDEAAAIAADLRGRFPSADAILDRELSRTLAALADPAPETARKVAAKLTPTSDPVEDVHYLIALGRLGGEPTSEVTKRIADALVRLDAKYDRSRINRERHWYLRLAEATSALLARHPGLAVAVVEHSDFGQPEHVWLAKLPGIDRATAARWFVASAGRIANFAWSPGLVEVLAALPDAEVRPLIPKLWDHGGLEDAIIPLLARTPTQGDRTKLVAGLRSLNPAVVREAAAALARLPTPADGSELLPAVQALRRVGADKADAPTRNALAALLRARTGATLDPTAAAWEAWLSRERPDLAKQFSAAGYDAAAWKARLGAIPWDVGSAADGRRVYVKATCAACHDGGQAVGPSLAGVAKRFGRDDLLTAVLDPSRDVPARYRPTRVATTDGQVFDGVLVYEAVDGVILQTGADATVRVAGDRIESRRPLATSPMPAGLLDKLSDREIADLFAHLKTLGDPSPTR